MLMSSQAMSGDVLGRDLGPLKPSSADEQVTMGRAPHEHCSAGEFSGVETEWVVGQVDKKPGMVDSGSQGAMASPDREAEGSAREGSAHAKECTWCGSSKTPMWRAGPAGPKTLVSAAPVVRDCRAPRRSRQQPRIALVAVQRVWGPLRARSQV